jgi:DNA-binding transcriptional LysR family regulator
MKVKLKHLEIFRAIIESGSYHKAATNLELTQPTLTVAIKNLERELGTSLIDRSTRYVKFTPAGKELYTHLPSIFERLEMALTSTKEVALGGGGSISVGYIDFAMLGPLTEVLTKFRTVKTNVHVDLNFISSRNQIEAVYKRTIDLGFIMSNDNTLPDDVCSKPISREGLVAVLPPNHKLTNRSAINLSDLKDEDFIMGDSTWSGFNNLVIRLCTSRGFQPRIRETAHLREELLSLVMAGLGTLIYPKCIENTSRFGLKVVPINDVKSIVTTSAVWLKRSSNKNLIFMLEQINSC